MTDRLRVGVIGAGIGEAHLDAYKQLPRVDVVALAGLDDDRVKRVATQYGVPRTFREYQELLAVPEIDAVSVCLPNVLHLPVALAALQAGKHVLVEKPLARTAEEATTLLEASRAFDRVLMVSFDKRYRSDSQWIKEYVDSGALGRIYYAKAHWMRRTGIPGMGSWFVSKQLAGGGPLVDLGVHVLDMAMYMLGEPQPLAVSASTYAEFGPRGLKGRDMLGQVSGQQLPYEVEDLATAFVRLRGGVTLLLEASWATHSSAGDDFGVTLYGTEGGVELLVKNYGYDNTVRVFTDINNAPVDFTPKLPRLRGHHQVIQRFVGAILDGTPAIPSAEDGLRRAQILDACYRSAEAGHEITI